MMYISVCYFNKDNKDERSNNDLIEKKSHLKQEFIFILYYNLHTDNNSFVTVGINKNQYYTIQFYI
ncbi:hypothetical protein HNP25_002370 [Arcicella rosea]|uniref:Uncharacterized protein n=1 Tax=Arcicella rosea TaxID=502909 RepID=A0A841EJK2_9BACT|nr:hypothetical protein [Arcicella rosea]